MASALYLLAFSLSNPHQQRYQGEGTVGPPLRGGKKRAAGACMPDRIGKPAEGSFETPTATCEKHTLASFRAADTSEHHGLQ